MEVLLNGNIVKCWSYCSQGAISRGDWWLIKVLLLAMQHKVLETTLFNVVEVHVRILLSF